MRQAAQANGTMLAVVENGIHPDLMHRITTMSAGTLDALLHNGTVLLLLLQNQRPRKLFGYGETVIVRCIIALIAVIVLGSDE
ncbi:hypothetical protein V1286_000804 [Bradyrhizobium algeriense]|uniref:Uncharacterized protein n=1 Tax=Bradyrhizobium algeriense TaxID=634784 RepID=A0ABU8B423_9BRAD